jgi:hypothetical protein
MRDAIHGIESNAAPSAVAEDEESGSSVQDGKVAAKTIKLASKKTTRKASSLRNLKVDGSSTENGNVAGENSKATKKASSLRNLKVDGSSTENGRVAGKNIKTTKKASSLRNLKVDGSSTENSRVAGKNIKTTKKASSLRNLNASKGTSDLASEETKETTTDVLKTSFESVETPLKKRKGRKSISGATSTAVAEDKVSGSSVEDGQVVAGKNIKLASKKTTKKASSLRNLLNAPKGTLDSALEETKETTTDVLNTSFESAGKNETKSSEDAPPGTLKKGKNRKSSTKTQNRKHIAKGLSEESTYSTVVSSRSSDSESNPEDTSNNDAVTSKLMRLLEEREESLKVGERRIAQLEGAVEKQLDLHTSLQIMLDNADDDIHQMDMEIEKLEDEICALQEANAGYEELQQELVKEKEKGAERELRIKALKEDASARQQTDAGYEALQQELDKEREKVAERELSLQALKEDASTLQETDAGYEKLQQELAMEREKVAEKELSIHALKEHECALKETYAGFEMLQQELVKEKEKVAERELSIHVLKEEAIARQETDARYEELQQIKESEKVAERELSVNAFKEDGSGSSEVELKSEEFEASAKLSEKNDAITEAQIVLAQLRNIAIATESEDDSVQELQVYKSEIVINRLQRNDGALEEVNEEQLSAKEYLEGEVLRLRAHAQKILEKSNATQELLELWTEAENEELSQLWIEAENELKRRSDTAGDQLDACSITHVVDNTLLQGKGWGLGGMFKKVKNIDDYEEAEADWEHHDAEGYCVRLTVAG